MKENNKVFFESDTVVKEYLADDALQKPEETIFKILKDKLKNFRMLDIGVGGGRTALHFGKLVKEYVGADYSEPMIEACRKRFSGYKNMAFKVMDVRNISDIEDNYFDFILFSFNGLDNVRHEERIKAFAEIKRILRPEGLFVFSSHNIFFAHKLYLFRLSLNPKILAKRLLRSVRFLLNNKLPWMIKKSDWTIINEEHNGAVVPQYYIKPSKQTEKLSDTGFRNIHLYSLDGGEINQSEMDRVKDPWIYYMCSK